MNINEVGSKQQPYVSSAVPPATGSRSQHAPQGPPFFGAYSARVPPPSNYNESAPPQHFAGYPQPRQVYPGPERDDREHRYERSNLPPPPAPSVGYQSARSSSQEYYPRHNPSYPAGAPPPPRPPPPLESRFDLRDRQGNASVNVVSQGDRYSSQKDPYASRPYGPAYPQGRSHSWNGEAAKRYPETYHASRSGPYTSAQRADGNDQEKSVSSEEGGIAKFRIIGNPGSPAAPQKSFVYAQPAPDSASSTAANSNPKSNNSVDADAMPYKGNEGSERAASPSQIDLHRRDDVSIMGCTCKKSKCLKLYCVCFGASVMCGINCRCITCHNTPSHEQSRKDAIRCILARNPSAFDTKFKKAADARVVTTNKTLAHKLGCKCRKSFCTKKYCECYNAGVKCSGSCRCVGCKNMPPGGFGARGYGKEAIALLPRSFAADVLRVKKEESKAHQSENNMMDAAHHLAFLKHASPARKNRVHPTTDPYRETTSMPSLAPSSSGTTSSPDEESAKRRIGLETGGVNSLLMAAYAMTELTEHSAPSTPAKEAEEVPFSSPKRKSSNEESPMATANDQFADAENTEDALGGKGGKQDPVQSTPGDERRIKRTRMGTVDRKKLNEETSESDRQIKTENKPLNIAKNADGSSIEQTKEEHEFTALTITSPTHESRNKTTHALTPISARCIDFQNMGIEKPMDEKKDDSNLTMA